MIIREPTEVTKEAATLVNSENHSTQIVAQSNKIFGLLQIQTVKGKEFIA